VLAVGLLKRGFDVKVFEKNITAIRGEGKYRGPIQVRQQLLSQLASAWHLFLYLSRFVTGCRCKAMR